MTFTKEQKIIVILLALGILGSISIVSYLRELNYQNNRHTLINEGEEPLFFPEKNEELPVESTDSEISDIIAIHIEGAVQNPGLYYLNEYSRYDDAVNKAGGFLEGADRSKINLAKKIYDEAFIYVPMIGENWQPTEDSQAGYNPNKLENDSAADLVNINTANLQELTSLPGIGDVYAQRIIDYRTTNGVFQSIEEIVKVSGIGSVTFENIKDKITK